MLVLLGRSFLQADIIVDSLWEQAHSVKTDTVFLQVIPNVIIIRERSINRIDITIHHISQDGHWRLRFYQTSHLVGITVKFVVSATSAAIQFGEAVNIYTMTLLTLVQLDQTTWTERGIILVNWDSEQFGLVQIEAVLINMEHQLIGRYLHWQDMIGNPLIKQVLL